MAFKTSLRTARSRLTLCAVAILFSVCVYFGVTEGQARERNLLEQINAFKMELRARTDNEPAASVTERWLGEDRPWAVYLKQQFVKSLTEEERKRHTALIAQRQCEQAMQIELDGFIRLHPELAAQFQNRKLRQDFIRYIIINHSHAGRRCRAIRILLPLIDKSKREGWLIPLSAHPRAADAARPNIQDLVRRIEGLAVLKNLALCYHDLASIRFIAEHHKHLRFFPNAQAEGFYFLYLARAFGVEMDDFLELSRKRRTGVSPAEVAKMRTVFARMDVEPASWRLWYRKNACSLAPVLLSEKAEFSNND